jgi:hypothetical protein
MAQEDYRIRDQASDARKSEGRHHQRGVNRQRFGDLNRAQLPGVDQAQRM